MKTQETVTAPEGKVSRAGPAFLRDRALRLLLFGGKGGVGKTTCAAAAALALAGRWPEASYVLVSTDPAHSLADSLAGSALPPNLTLVELDAGQRLAAFKSAHGGTLREIAARGTFLDDDDIGAFLDLSLPGLDELMAFLEISRWIEEDRYTCVVVDTAPWGHTLRLLEMPELITRWLGALDALLAKHRYMKRLYRGAYRRDDLDDFLLGLAASVERMKATLLDPVRCRFVPVLLAEPLSVTETVGLMDDLGRLKIPTAELVVNRLYPDTDCRVCADGLAGQVRELKRIHDQVSGQVVWGLPLFPDEVRGRERLELFWGPAAELADGARMPRRPAAAQPRVASPPPLPAPEIELLIFAGKGGVGKTTLACATALRLARERPGAEILLLSTDPAHSLAACLDRPVRPEPAALAPGLRAMEIDPQAELEALKQRYASDLERAFDALLPNLDLTFDREVMERILDLSPPGLDEVMALSRAMDLLASGADQVLVLDAAPTGHLIRLLEMPELIDRWLKVVFGLFLKYKTVFRLPGVSERLVRLSKDLKRFRALLADPRRASLYAVTIPTEMAYEETGDLLAACRRISIGAPVLFVNLATPESDCPLCSALRRREAGVERRFRDAFPGAHQALVFRGGEPRGLERLGDLGGALFGAG
ncbi:MAG: ArsA family ATPase [Candidatus Rokubacteria bacterium]|nr:ArsA family ATPase [Candidatus Rokubacteria bacterium]